MNQLDSEPSDSNSRESLLSLQDRYYFNNRALESTTRHRARHFRLGMVGITGLMGPFGAGATLLGRQVAEENNEIHPLPVITTRARRPNDPESYRTRDEGVTADEIIQKAARHAVLTFQVGSDNTLRALDPTGIESHQMYLAGPISHREVEQLQAVSLADFRRVLVVREKASYQEHLKNALEHTAFQYDRLVESDRLLDFAMDNVDQSWLDVVTMSDNVAEAQKALTDAERIAMLSTYDSMPVTTRRALIADMRAVLREVTSRIVVQ